MVDPIASIETENEVISEAITANVTWTADKIYASCKPGIQYSIKYSFTFLGLIEETKEIVFYSIEFIVCKVRTCPKSVA